MNELTSTVETIRCYNHSERKVGEVDVEVKRIADKVWSAIALAERVLDPNYALPSRFDWYDCQNVGELGYEGPFDEWAKTPPASTQKSNKRCIVD
jgi:hypothetical protein